MRIYFKTRGFTDRLYMLNFAVTWLFVWACWLLTLFSGKLGVTDLSVLDVCVSCAFAELGLHTGLIVWKAKVENLSKYGNKENIQM